MRILEICLSDYLGGLELYHVRCCEELSRQGHELTAVCKKGSRIDERHVSGHYEIYRLKRFHKYFPIPSAWKVSRVIRKNKIEIIHVHHAWDLLHSALAKILSGTKVKLVYSRQMEIPFSKKDLYHTWLYRRIDLLLCITKKLKRDAEKYININPGKIELLYLGTAKKASDCDCAAVEQYHLKGLLVGIFSRIQNSKGQHVVVEAANYLKDMNIPCTFLFYGDVMVEEDMDLINDYVSEKELNDRVKFMGFEPNPRSIMGCFDIIIQPSKRETFGLVLIEAMREGVLAIGTNSGGIPEIIDNETTGFLFDFNEPERLAEIIKYCSENPQRRLEIANAGKEKADTQFDETHHFTSLAKRFQALVS